MNEISIISLLPKEINKYYLELRKKLEDQFGLEINHNVPAHITFKYGFPVEDLTKVEEVIQEVCETHPKSIWELRDFGCFHQPEKYVAFIDCVPTQSIRKTHKALFDGLRKLNWVTWGEFDSDQLHYHVTIASKGITTENFELVWLYLNRLTKPLFEFQFDNLAVFRIEKDPPFVSSMFHFPA